MKFGFFNLMPWPHYPEPPHIYPTPNDAYDPLEGKRLYDDYIDLMVFAEACGFDWVGCNEHHFSPYGLMPNCNLIGGALARETTTCGVTMAGNLVPLNNPVRIAEEYAMIDVMSGGRLMGGLLRGVPHEYIAYNADPSESRRRLREATQLIIKCWTEPQPFGWEGEFYQFRSISIWPRPIQKPHPRLIMSASNEEAAEFAAESRAIMGLAYISNMAYARATVDFYHKAARANGWESGPEDVMAGVSVCICDTDEEAHRTIEPALAYLNTTLMKPVSDALKLVVQSGYHRGKSGEEYAERLEEVWRPKSIEEQIAEGTIIAGSPASVVKQLKRFREDLGAGQINMSMVIGNMPFDKVRRGMELFRDQVLPHVRDL